jgi:outer membrane protein
MNAKLIRILCLAALLCGAARADEAPGPLATLPARLDLPSAIRYALDHNYAILQAREQIRLQEGLVLQVGGQRIPNLGATGEYQRNSKAISQSQPPITSLWTIQARATQVIYAGGGLDASIQGAKLTRDAARFDLQAAIDSALLEVRTRFYAVLLAREEVSVQEENVSLARRQLEDTQNQLHAGSVSNFEVLRAQVALANAQPDLITARNNYRIALEQLRQSLGVPAGIGASATFTEVVGTLDITPSQVEPDAALASAHEHRPELLRIEKQKAAAEQAMTAAKAGYYPTLSAYGGYEVGGAHLEPSGSFAGGNFSANGWLAGLQSSWSLFDGQATRGKVQQADAALNQARLAYSSQELAIDVEVRQALSSLQEAGELVDASRKTVEQAEEALRLANERFRAGAATQLDVLTSQTSLTQTRTNQLRANYNYLVATASLRRAMGLGDVQISN